MHEVGLVNQAAAEFLTEIGAGPVASVDVAIGPKVVPEVAQTAWQVAVAGTPAELAEVNWIQVPNTLRCFECGQDYSGDSLDKCPTCGGNGLVIAEPAEVTIRQWR